MSRASVRRAFQCENFPDGSCARPGPKRNHWVDPPAGSVFSEPAQAIRSSVSSRVYLAGRPGCAAWILKASREWLRSENTGGSRRPAAWPGSHAHRRGLILATRADTRSQGTADEPFRGPGLDQPWNLVIGHQVIHAQALLFDPSAGPLVLGAVSQGTEGGPKTFSIPSISALV